MTSLLDDILSSLEEVREPDERGCYRAICPFHQDQSPVLYLHPEQGWVCVAGCRGSISELAGQLEAADDFDFVHDISKQRERKRIFTAKALLEEKGPAINWQWQGYLARGHITLLSARPKMGKTTLDFYAIEALLDGRDFLDLPTALGGKVLLLSEESRGLLRQRIQTLGLGRDDLLILLRHDISGWSDALTTIRQATQEDEVALVIIDTLTTFWDVWHTGDVTEVIQALLPLQNLARQLGFSVLLVHHLRKIGGHEGTAHLGSSGLVAAVDIAIEMSLDPNSKRRRRLIALSRFEETPQELVIELGEDGKYTSLGPPSEVSRSIVKAQAVAALPGPQEEPITSDELRQRLEPRPSSGLLSEVLGELVRAGQAEKLGAGVKGDPFRYRQTKDSDSVTLHI